MLNVFVRRAAPWACACLLGVPMAYAAGQDTSAPFERYQGWRDEPLQDWRAANQRVGEIGGWRTYLRESQPADDAAGRDAQDDHAHHHHH